MTQADQGFLWEMLYPALYLPEGQSPFPKEIVREPEIAAYVFGWGREGDQGLIALDQSTLQPLGAAWQRLFTAATKGYGYLDDHLPEIAMALLPEYRNRGLGTKLLNQLIERARWQYPALSLSVSASNPAIRLYQRLGFEILNRSGTALIMQKKLNQTEKEPAL